MGEVWTEVLSELDQEQVRPTTPDLEAVEAISRAIENRAEIVAGTQQELMEANNNQEILDEQEFYAEVDTEKLEIQFFFRFIYVKIAESFGG